VKDEERDGNSAHGGRTRALLSQNGEKRALKAIPVSHEGTMHFTPFTEVAMK